MGYVANNKLVTVGDVRSYYQVGSSICCADGNSMVVTTVVRSPPPEEQPPAPRHPARTHLSVATRQMHRHSPRL